jgi:hypothetical protein
MYTYFGPMNTIIRDSQENGNKIIISGKAKMKKEKKLSPVLFP